MQRFRWVPEELRKVPTKPGVYTVWGFIRGNALYVGMARNLRERLLRHFYEGDIGHHPAEVEIATEVQERQQRALEQKLIHDLNPPLNMTI